MEKKSTVWHGLWGLLLVSVVLAAQGWAQGTVSFIAARNVPVDNNP